MSRKFWFAAMSVATLFVVTSVAQASRKPHAVVLGAARKVAYSKAGDPAGAAAGENP